MNVLEFLKDLFFPRKAECMGCGSRIGMDSNDLCEDCRRKMARAWIGPRMPEATLHLCGAAYAYRYASPAGGVVRKLKYSGVALLADEMANDLARAASLLRIQNPLASFVPMHPQRMRKRGFNHSELLARKTAEKMEIECAALLRRTRNAPQQARLNREQRLRNLRGAFAAADAMRDKIKGRNILLIDDVFTTGATAKSCAEALLDAGAAQVYFVAYAHGERS